MKRFAIIGVGGYIAPRHLKAIKDTGNVVVAALDKNDSVGIIDSYFPEADFFTEFERFDRHLELLRREGANKIDYVSICSPNYLHDAHVRFALRIGANAICEKPLVLNPWNVTALEEIEQETGHRINTILQLRLHPAIVALKQRINREPKGKIYDIELTYITSRGHWYYASWKGDVKKSGGIATNIGVHFFDMLTWIFGDVKTNVVNIHLETKAASILELERARVRWFLSLDHEDLPAKAKAQQARTYRSITMDGQEIEFSEGFGELHTRSYEQILNGKGFTTKDILNSITIVSEIRNAKQVGLQGDYIQYSNKSNSNRRRGRYEPLPALKGNCGVFLMPQSKPTDKKNHKSPDYFVHETSIVDQGARIGSGTKIWHFCHVSSNTQIGQKCILGQNVYIGEGVVIGNNVKIQNNVSVYTGTVIEDDVFLGPSCVLTNVTNPRSQVIRHTLYEKTVIRRGTTIGANATIVCGIELGRYCFIAAGAVVAKDVGDYALMMGVPARQVGWISRHGIRLPKPDSTGIMICPESGYRYKEVKAGVLKCLDLDEEAPLPPDKARGTLSYDEFKKQAK